MPGATTLSLHWSLFLGLGFLVTYMMIPSKICIFLVADPGLYVLHAHTEHNFVFSIIAKPYVPQYYRDDNILFSVG
jgi:hypothetical protein